MANVSSLQKAVESWGLRVFVAAVDDLTRQDDRAVPRSPTGTGELANSRKIERHDMTATVEYPTDIANYNETGTGPHVIRARRPGGVLVFAWPAGPPELAGPDGLYRFRQVNHPGSKVNQGWFSKTWNEDSFAEALDRAAARVRL